MFKRLCAICVMIAICFAPSPLFAAASQNDVAAAKKISASVNAFAFDMYRELAKKERENIIFSPESVSMAIALAYEGAKEQTRAEMKKSMHYGKDIRFGFDAYMRMLKSTPKESGELIIATAAWPDFAMEMKQDYLARIGKYYRSEVRRLNFLDRGNAAKVINNWADKHTRGEIKEIVKPEDLFGCALALGNATYFKAQWAEQFKEKDTKEETFYKAPGAEAKLPLMHRVSKYAYHEAPTYQAARLNYKGGAYSLVVLLPKDRYGIDKLEKSMKAKEFSEVLSKGRPELLNLYLPKFRAESPRYELSQNLKMLGIKQAFSDKSADFTGIGRNTQGNHRIFIDEVFHRAIFDITEKDTTAAAVTVVVMKKTTCLRPQKQPEPILFRADHPFLYFIVDNRTDMILFMGRFAGK